MFLAHMFKQRSVGEREEVLLKLFNMDGSPYVIDLSIAVLEAWQGAYDNTLDYAIGSLVRHEDATYLAVQDAPHTALGPGEGGAMERFAFYQNGDRNGYVLTHDLEVIIADLESSAGYNFGGVSRWFRVNGTPGEEITLMYGGGGNKVAVYGVPNMGSTFPSGTKVIIPDGGGFNMEVAETVPTIKWVGPNGPQPITNPWTLFA